MRRSADNLKDLATLGIENKSQLIKVFNQAIKGTILSEKTSQYGTTITRNIKVGNKGSIDVGFFYKGGNMDMTPTVTTLIPKIHK